MNYIFDNTVITEDGVELLRIYFKSSIFVSECNELDVLFSFSMICANGFDEIEVYDIFKEEFYEILEMMKISKSSIEIQVRSVTLKFNDEFYNRKEVEKILRSYIKSQVNLKAMRIN